MEKNFLAAVQKDILLLVSAAILVFGGMVFFNAAIPHANAQSHGSPCALTSQCNSGLCCTVGGSLPNQCHYTSNTHGGTCQSGSTPPPPTTSCSGPVKTYAEINFQGFSAGFNPGSYTLSQLQACGVQDNSISSLQVPSGYRITLYENDSYGGATLVNSGGQIVSLIDYGKNDTTSSLKVEQLPFSNSDASRIYNLSGIVFYSPIRMNLAWPPVPGATDYHIERCTGDSCSTYNEKAAVTSTFYSDTNVSSGNTYRYRVKPHNHAVNIFGAGGFFKVRVSSESNPPPSAQNISLSARCGYNSITLFYTAGSSDYHIYRCTGSTCAPTTQIAAVPWLTAGNEQSHYFDSSVINGTTYRYLMKAHKHNNNTFSSSNIVSGKPSCSTSTAPPTPTLSGSSALSPTRANLSWTSSTGASDYHIYRCSGTTCTPTTQITAITSTNYSDTNVVLGSYYRYSVKAHNHSNGLYSGASNIVTVYVSSSPPPPSSVTFNSSNFSGSASIHCYNSSYQANLSWSRISNANFYFIGECSNTTLSSCTAKAFTSAPFFFERNVPPSSIKRYVLASYTTSGAVFQPATNIISVSAPSALCQ